MNKRYNNFSLMVLTNGCYYSWQFDKMRKGDSLTFLELNGVNIGAIDNQALKHNLQIDYKGKINANYRYITYKIKL